MRQITVLRDGRALPCGKILIDPDGVKVWERKVSERRHLFRYGRAWDGTEVKDAWTIGEELLGQLREIGVGRIRYLPTQRGRCGAEVYEVEMAEFLKQARELDQSEWTCKTEPQWALPRRFWEKRGSEAKQLQLELA